MIGPRELTAIRAGFDRVTRLHPVALPEPTTLAASRITDPVHQPYHWPQVTAPYPASAPTRLFSSTSCAPLDCTASARMEERRHDRT